MRRARTNIYTFIIGTCFIISSCNYEPNNDSQSTLESTHQKLDPVKSGIIYMKSTQPIRENDVERVVYFDDYGSKVRIESTASMKVGTQTVSNTHITINAGGYSTVFDPEKKTGTKTKLNQAVNSLAVSFSPFTLEHMHKEGTEEVVGKTCDIYTMNYPEIDSSKFKYAVWNSLKLRETISSNQFSYDYLATKFDENVEIQPVMFIVPDSITVREPSLTSDSTRYSYLNDTLRDKFNKLKGSSSKKTNKK